MPWANPPPRLAAKGLVKGDVPLTVGPYVSQPRSYPTVVGLEKLRSPCLLFALERIQLAPQLALDTSGVFVPIDAAFASYGPFKAVLSISKAHCQRAFKSYLCVVVVLAPATFVVLELDVVIAFLKWFS